MQGLNAIERMRELKPRLAGDIAEVEVQSKELVTDTEASQAERTTPDQQRRCHYRRHLQDTT